jgi:hypothetical protein
MPMSRHHCIIVTLSTLLLSTLFIGCADHPSEKNVQADLKKYIEYRWPGELAIVEYAHTCVAGNDGKYTVTYRAKARFLQDVQGCVTTCCGNMGIDRLFRGHFHWEFKSSSDPHVIRKGDLFVIEGDKTYRKTEAGWTSEVFSF